MDYSADSDPPIADAHPRWSLTGWGRSHRREPNDADYCQCLLAHSR